MTEKRKTRGIRRRGKVWEAYVHNSRTGRQVTRSGFKTMTAAKEWRDVEAVAISRGERIEPSRTSVQQFLEDEWFPVVRAGSKKPSTIAGYGSIVRLHLVPHIGDVQLTKLAPADIARMYRDLAASNLSGRTIHHIGTCLSGALEFAVGRYLLRNPARQVKPEERPRIEETEMRAWTPEQVRAFLSTIEGDRLAPLFATAVFTGMRRGELLGLRWTDVDLDARRVHVRRARVSVGYQVNEGAPKTRKATRAVDLSPETARVLKRWRAQQLQERMQWGEAWTDSGYVFTRTDGEPIHPHTATQTFARRVKTSGLPRITFHGLRHTCASLWLAAGLHPSVVKERLGHSSISITLDLYSHTTPTMQADGAAQVDALVFGS